MDNFSFTFLLTISIVICILLAVYGLRKQESSRVRTFSFLMIAITLWTMFYLLGLLSPTLKGKTFWLFIKYLGAASTPALWIWFSVLFTQNNRLVHSKLFKLTLFILPLLVIGVVFTNQYHHLFWTNIWIEPGFPEEFVDHGPLYYPIYVIPSYLSVLLSSIFYIRYYLKTNSLFKRQSVAMVLGSLAPLLGAASFQIFSLDLIPKLDETILFFLFSGVMFGFGVFKYGAMDILPIAHQIIVDSINTAIIVVDHEYRIVELNPRAIEIFSLEVKTAIGKSLYEIVPQLRENNLEMLENNAREYEFRLGVQEPFQYYLLRTTMIQTRANKQIGTVFAITDISELKLNQLKLMELAIRDPLTGVFNRREFYQLFEQEWNRAKRYSSETAIVGIDIDDFKKINDQYGHIAGDQALIQFAAICQENMRLNDIFARFGGEEFICCLPETNQNQAKEFAEKIRGIVEDLQIEVNGMQFGMSISLGVSSLNPNTDEHMDEAFRRADAALYHSKQTGKNKVSVWKNIPESGNSAK